MATASDNPQTSVASVFPQHSDLPRTPEGIQPDGVFPCADSDFLDLDHHVDPFLKQDLEYWGSKVKPAGLIELHDYHPHVPGGSTFASLGLPPGRGFLRT